MSVEKITDAEWRVMHVVWKSEKPVTSNEVVVGVVPETGWNPQTVRTLLTRLVEKEVLAATKEKGVLLYTPLATREESIRVHGQSFLERVFEGNAREMLVHFVRDRAFSPDQINELRKLLDKELSHDD
ncbi:MAG: BlaI/MecI/CopY family transcriptional regulator [Planctomycetaceae bacterium]|nr:BlaI/MecI/CopY family transcriptional regulator [Planctomycetaceae bacterium]